MNRIEVLDTPISGFRVLIRLWRADDRGFLERLFDEADLQPVLIGQSIAQINRTNTREAGTVRGLHLQLPPAEEFKMVSCLRGSVFDVAVDLRPVSPTIGAWFGYNVSGDNGRQRARLGPPGGLRPWSADARRGP